MRSALTWAMGTLCLFAGCWSSSAPRPTGSIVLATTTSVRDTGLLDELLPLFRAQTGIEVKVVAVGSGQALELGRRGDADILLTHAPAAEQEFLNEGHGVDRRALMHNEFVIVGPPDDPAGVREATTATEALARIAEAAALFVSRGDESGTHLRERSLWDDAEVAPTGDWYIRAGAGMAEALRMADQRQAYTLSDRGTYLATGQRHELAILLEGDPALRNDYSVMPISASKHPSVNQQAAEQFADFLCSPETQQRIAAFRRDEFGESLFHPDAVPASATTP